MVVGIVGLGLIGGSFAKAYKDDGHKVYAIERDRSIFEFAKLSGVIDGELLGEDASTVDGGGKSRTEGIRRCDLILVALYPKDAIAFINEYAPQIHRSTIVVDCCGTKKNVCKVGFAAANRYKFTFIGGHPMAGTEQTGYKHSKSTMFRGASMIIVPPVFDDITLLENVKNILASAGFGRFTVTTAEKHDEMIAYTSQLAHVVSNAFIKSPVIREHKGFSAGSYRDLTRVAWLNESMWSELFMENRDNLLPELDFFISSLRAYRDAISGGDGEALEALLREGKNIKEMTDRRQTAEGAVTSFTNVRGGKARS